MKSITEVGDALRSRIEMDEEALREFAQKILDNPEHAERVFNWAADEFKAAARLVVYRELLGALEYEDPDNPEASPDKLRRLARYCREQVQRKATSVESSNLGLSNMLSRFNLAAWADLIDPLGGPFSE